MNLSRLNTGSTSSLFRIGIVGHRYLANQDTTAFVADNCFAILEQQQTVHKDISALSALAEGADTLFAEAAVGLNIRLEVVRPFEEYALDITNPAAKRRYERLRTSAYSEAKLDYTGRSDSAYLAGMHWIVDNSDLLVAVWDGSPARGSGGTGDAIRRASLVNCDWIHLDVTDLSVRFHFAQKRGR